MMIQRIVGTVLLFAIFQSPLWSQKSSEADQPERIYEEAMMHFERGYYGVARELFGKSKTLSQGGIGSLSGDAAFYEALSARKLNNADAAWLLEHFLEAYPQSTRLSHARFLL